MNDTERHDLRALAAAHRGDLAEAAVLFDEIAHTRLAAGQRGHAFAALANAAQMKSQAGDLHGALAAIDEALTLPAEPQVRALALMTRGSVLDALDHADAPQAWMEANEGCGATAQGLFCLAHATGGLIKHGAPPEIAAGVLGASRGMPVSQVVGLLGAIGESAGPAGTPLLAQAVLLMGRRPTAFTLATAPYLDLLAARAGEGSRLALGLCAVAVMLAQHQRTDGEHAALQAGVEALLGRCARARGVDLEALLTYLTTDTTIELVEAQLRALIPDGRWVIDS